MGNIFSVNSSCDATASRFLGSIFRRAAYVGKLEINLRHLKTSLEELKCLQNDVKRRVAVAEQQPHMKQLDQVQNWISRVNSLEARVREAVDSSSQQTESLCCGGYCSKSYMSSYKYGTKVAKLLVEVADLKSKGLFPEVAEKLPQPIINERPLEPTVGLDSLLDKVWSHVEDVEVGVLGLYGMGGVGKTTLLTQIHNKFQHTDFDVAIWIVVSKDLRVEAIQNRIGEKIGLRDPTWELKDPDEKADAISSLLSRKKFVLFLDDLWERVDITKIGVPFPDQHNKSKVIFTTRSEDVCGFMGAQQKILVECLPWDKAWDLFQEKTGRDALQIHADIPKLAEAVAAECGGLPLALTTVGRVMSTKKTPQEWNHAIRVLKKASFEFSGMGDQVFPLLKFSYDNFPSDKVRACFLYCALFSEDYDIPKDDLVWYWMCENMLDEHSHPEEARDESYHIIGTLLNVCMLEEGKDGCVKMHDVVRDMALWLACDPKKADDSFLVHTGADLIEAPIARKWKNSKRVSLMANHIKELVETPNSPYLLTLFLRRNHLQKIATGFFNSMSNLLVLDLSSNKDLAQLPVGVSSLVSLHHLNLSNTGIKELPTELKCLERLEYLNFENTPNLYSLPPTLISSFRMLKVLRMVHSGPDSEDQNHFDDEKAMVKELHGLKHLDYLTLDIRSTSCFQNFISCKLLSCCTRLLYLLGYDNHSSSLDISSMGKKHLEQLNIRGYPNLEDVVLDIDWAGGLAGNNLRNAIMRIHNCFHGLQMIMIQYCDNLKDLTQLCFAPNLISVYVLCCSRMETIIDIKKLGGDANVRKEFNLFAKMGHLDVRWLPALKSIYGATLPFPCLSYINVDGCPELKKLPLDSSSAQGGTNLTLRGEQDWWDGLQWDDQLALDTFRPSYICWNVDQYLQT
ncbi:PREDICTED: probable disease resistance protein At5g63020 [Fragaria vesca subsp. vesca]|uniref:probable disease resistance protein At5g63020 n=1 Tax=Fragaria vesca subsp. vesca TaxID=101020 RepID=UPI0002C3052E|nr:PREDICTED: probable disease resistance protein At5g63020 [Fragaria vesca subsp. vesca]